jgi:hypothetical protein
MALLSRLLLWIGFQPPPPPPPVSRGALLGFLAELSSTSSAALYRFSLLEQAAGEWLRLRDRLAREGRLTIDDRGAQLQEQTRIFEALEAFLAAWTRVSLILFPASRSSTARRRAKALRAAMGMTQASPLTERSLRDGWIHFDERLDKAGTTIEAGACRPFVHSSEVTETRKRLCVRIVEVNTLIVWCHDRWGRPVPTDLRRLIKGLRELGPRIHLISS